MDRLVLISTVSITRDKTFVNELLPGGLNCWLFNRDVCNNGQLNFDVLMFRTYFCIILTHDNKINT